MFDGLLKDFCKIILLIFDLILINSFTQRNLKFTIEDEKYKILSKAAKEAFRQIYNLKIDFEGRLKEVLVYLLFLFFMLLLL